MKLGLTGRIILTVLCFGIALAGFMVKLPAVFRHHDTELHTLFYFLAAGFLNVLFVKRNLIGHVLVFALLYAMGVGIEYAQDYSNTLVGQRIHGRYDPEDIQANLKGLICFSILWAGYVLVWYATRSMRSKTNRVDVQQSSPAAVNRNPVAPSGQSEVLPNTFLDTKDRTKLQEAINLLTEVKNQNPAHRSASGLTNTISELEDILHASEERRNKED